MPKETTSSNTLPPVAVYKATLGSSFLIWNANWIDELKFLYAQSNGISHICQTIVTVEMWGSFILASLNNQWLWGSLFTIQLE